MTEITLIPAGNGGTPTYSISSDPLHSIAPGKYAPPAFATIDWNAEPYKTLMQWFSQAGTAISKSADYWPLLLWMISEPTAMAHVSYLSAMSQDIACYTDPSYGDGVQHFKEEIVKDSYTTPAWCTKSSGPGPGPNNCAATGQSCSDIDKCCDGFECKDGKCAEKSSSTMWWVLGGIGVVALAGVGLVMASGGAKANPCGCGQRNPRHEGLNNADREQWIDNDEGLYSWWKSSRQSKREFIKENKTEIDAAINSVLHAPPRQPSWRGY
jgi:hypothetical protein